MFTEKQRKKYADEDTVMKCFMLLKNDTPCLDNKEVRPFVENVQLTDEDVANANAIFDLILDAHTCMVSDVESVEDANERKKLAKYVKRVFGRTHFVSIIPITQRAIEDGRDCTDMAEFFGYFFSDNKRTSISDLYSNACQSGSNHAPQVQKRLDALNEEYDKFFENYTKDEVEAEIEDSDTGTEEIEAEAI